MMHRVLVIKNKVSFGIMSHAPVSIKFSREPNRRSKPKIRGKQVSATEHSTCACSAKRTTGKLDFPKVFNRDVYERPNEAAASLISFVREA